MKKAIAIGMMFLMLCSYYSVGFCEEASVIVQQIAKKDGTGQFQIMVTNEIEYEFIIVQVFGPEGSLRQIHQEISNAKNTISIPFLPVEGEVDMKVLVSVPKISGNMEIFEKDFKFYSYIVQQSAIQEIINSKLEESIYKNKEILSIPTEEIYDSLTNKSFVLQKLAEDFSGQNDIEVSEFLNAFNKYTRLASLNSKKAKLIKYMIDNYSKELNLTEAKTEYDWYLKSAKKTEIEEKLANGQYQSTDEFIEEFKIVNFLFKLSETPALNIIDILKTQNQKYHYEGELFNIDFSDYDALLYVKCEYARTLITGVVYNDLEELKIKFDEAVEKAENYTPVSNNGGGGKNGIVSSFVIAETKIPLKQNEDRNVFEDIDNVKWAQEAILALAQEDIILGTAHGQFSPNDFVTREQFVKMIVRAFKLSQNSKQTEFSDVSKGDWFYSDVQTAASLGIANGNDGKFGVGDYITRQDMATILYRLSEQLKINIIPKPNRTLSDINSVAEYAKQAVLALYDGGIVNGIDNGVFGPQYNTTRAQAAKLIYDLRKWDNNEK